MASSVSSDNGDFGFQIAPMVDVVFVLLLFFMALSGMQQVEKHFGINLPGRTGPGTPPLVIDIRSTGEVQCNGLQLLSANETQPDRLTNWLKDLAAADPNTAILIRPDSQAEHARFIEVLSTIQKAGLKKIALG